MVSYGRLVMSEAVFVYFASAAVKVTVRGGRGWHVNTSRVCYQIANYDEMPGSLAERWRRLQVF